MFAWLDDWLIGAFLLYGAWRVGRDAVGGQASLAAAWGFTLAIAIGSFLTGVFGDADPTGAPRTVVVAIKAVMLLLAIAALVSVLRWRHPAARPIAPNHVAQARLFALEGGVASQARKRSRFCGRKSATATRASPSLLAARASRR